MRDYLKKYEVTITTKGPVYIGSGKDINKKEYYVEKNEKKIYIFDMIKFFDGISKLKLEKKYQEYLFNSKNNKNLNDFFFDNKVKKDTFLKWVDYKLDYSDIYDEKTFKNRNINTFIKESGNNIYIPGSSLKGAIRTALLTEDIIKNKNKYSNFIGKSINDTLSKKVEEVAFNTLGVSDVKKDAVNDIMSCIRVSDSEIVSKKRMMVAQRKDFKAKNKKKNGSKEEKKVLPIFYECIKPNTNIKTTITIDTSKQKDLDINRIISAIETYSNNQFENYGSKFKDVDKYSKKTLILGGYSGFVSKTVNYALYKNETVKINSNILNGKKAFKKHKHNLDKDTFGISPRTYKYVDFTNKSVSKNLGMGLVELSFKEI